MAFSLGSLFIELKANTAQFLDGMTKASAYSQKTGRDIERSFSRIGGAASTILAPLGAVGAQIGRTLDMVGEAAGRTFGQIGKMGGAFGVAAGAGGGMIAAMAAIDLGAIAVATHAAHVAGKFHDLSQSSGVAVESLSALAYVAKQNGLETEALAGALEKLNKSAFKAATAPEGAKNAYTRMGIAIKDSAGNLRSTEAIFTDISTKFRAMPDGLIKTAMAMELFGKSGAAVIPTLNDDVARLTAEARELGVVLDAQTAAAADAFTDQLDKMKAAGQGASFTLMKELLPALQTVTGEMVDGLKQPNSAFRALIEVIGFTTKTLISFGALVSSIFRQIGYVVGTALAVAIEGLMTFGSAMFEVMRGNFGKAADIAREGFIRIKGELANFLSESGELWVGYAKLSTGVFGDQPTIPGAPKPKGGGGGGVDTSAQDPLAARIKQRIALLERETAEYLKVAAAAGDSPAASRMADANREAEKFIGALKDEALHVKANQKIRTDLIATIDKQAERIRALFAVQAVATGAAKLGVEMEKQTRAYRDQITAVEDLTAAYQTGGLAVALAEVDQQLDKERRELENLADEYDLLTQKPGVTAAQLSVLVAALDSANTKFREHYDQLVKIRQANIGLEIAQSASKIGAQIAGIELLTKAYGQSAEAINAAGVAAELLNWQLEHGAATQDQIDEMRSSLEELSIVRRKDQKVQEEAGFSIIEIYKKQVVELEKIRSRIVANGRDTLLIDAQIYDSNRSLIEQWNDAAMKIGTMAEKWRAFGNEVVLMGEDLEAKFFGSLFRAVDDLSSKLAEFVVKGKADFKSLFQSLAQDILKAQFQSLIGSIARKIGSVFNIDLGRIAGLGGKPSGTRGDPFYTRSADALGGAGGVGGILERLGIGSESGGGDGLSSIKGIQEEMLGQQNKIWREMSDVFKSIGAGLKSLLSGIASIAKSIFSFFGNIFGGGLASGGPVEPGKAYIVGEKHPEWFMPDRAGTIVPTLSNSSQRPLVYSPTFNISTPDVDSFRRSQGQITADFYRMGRLAHARS